jgi:molybdenum cofactor biosynthesis protein B
MTTLNCTVLTVSDSRSVKEDTSGALLEELIGADGHSLIARTLVRDDIYQVRSVVSAWIADEAIQVIITTGGTGFTGRDSTPEALLPLFDKTIDGFGELFRQVSFEEIGASTIQSRCVGGLANGTLIFALPGSSNAVRTGWTRILSPQLNADTRPCNFVELLPRFRER